MLGRTVREKSRKFRNRTSQEEGLAPRGLTSLSSGGKPLFLTCSIFGSSAFVIAVVRCCSMCSEVFDLSRPYRMDT
jgi:hypothetical protein